SGRLRDVVHARVTELAAMTDDDFEAVGDMPTGRSSYGRFMEARTFDVWIHERDISVPLRLVGQDGGQPAEMALEEVRRALGYVVGKKIGLDDGAGIAFQLTGALEARLNVMVDGRAVVVDELADPRCTVTADFLAFMLLACGRIDPEVAIADGRISWSGDDAIGGVAARQLRFTT
ncbi:MAG: hypothetical protein JWQ70_1259, partial [Aeromicrobium sp.]|nr:hypothetical protein [Aeromicrobium sp.]